jgi:hypothetical protein
MYFLTSFFFRVREMLRPERVTIYPVREMIPMACEMSPSVCETIYPTRETLPRQAIPADAVFGVRHYNKKESPRTGDSVVLPAVARGAGRFV